MSEKIKLIPAAELPVAESDDVEALVIEGGELKRKEVGGEVRSVNGIKPDATGNVEVGDSGGGYDMVIMHTTARNDQTGIDEDDLTITHGSYEDLRKKMLAYIVPSVCIFRGLDEYEGRIEFSSFKNIDSITFIPDVEIKIHDGQQNYYHLYPDGTVGYHED